MRQQSNGTTVPRKPDGVSEPGSRSDRAAPSQTFTPSRIRDTADLARFVRQSLQDLHDKTATVQDVRANISGAKCLLNLAIQHARTPPQEIIPGEREQIAAAIDQRERELADEIAALELQKEEAERVRKEAEERLRILKSKG